MRVLQTSEKFLGEKNADIPSPNSCFLLPMCYLNVNPDSAETCKYLFFLVELRGFEPLTS